VIEFLPLLMFLGICVTLMLGYPVAFTLAGTALLFALGGIAFGHFDANLLLAYPDRAVAAEPWHLQCHASIRG